MRKIAMALLTTVALAACTEEEPNSESNRNSEGSALSKAEYIAQADAVCKEAETDINALDPPATSNDLDNYAAEVTDISDEAISDLRALRPPPADAEMLGQIVDNIERSIELLPDYVRATQAQDGPQMRDLEAQLQGIQDETTQLAHDYGFEECGGDEGAPHS
jgi:ABC-type Fe3+-hydroxamate transport system substrate-binding protein